MAEKQLVSIPGTEQALSTTRISGKLIGLRRDDGPPGRRPTSGGRPDTRGKKPRHQARDKDRGN